MLIGIDASRANRKQKTGVEWYSYHLIKAFARIDPRSSYILYTNTPLKGSLSDMPKNFQEKILRWPIKYLWTQIRLSIELYRSDIDYFFIPAHTMPLITFPKTAVTIHDLGFEEMPDLYDKKSLYYHKYSLRKILKKADKIITISNFTRDLIIDKFNFPRKKIIAIPLAYDKKRFKTDMNERVTKKIKDRHGIDYPYLLVVGRIEKKKNVIGILKAFEIFQKKYSLSHKLVLIGIPGFGYEDILKFISAKNLEKKVLFFDWISEEDLPYLYRAADLYITLSHYEGFGITPLEAMACGIPVVCSDIPAFKELYQGVAEIVDKDDSRLIAEKIHKVLVDLHQRKKMIELGVNFASKYDYCKSAQKTLNFLQN